MADNRLVGIHIPLTPEQKRLLSQISNEDFTELVVVAATSQQDIPGEHGPTDNDRKLVNVLYETNTDLVERIEQNPTVRQDIEQRITARTFGPTIQFGAKPLAPQITSSGTLNVGFTGIIGTVAAW
jgi:hypothetical protein